MAKRGRGRPSLDVKATVVRLYAHQHDRIERLVGHQKKSEFVRQAVEAELRRHEKPIKRRKPKVR